MSHPLLRSLTFLGTSSGVPTAYRNVSGSCLSFTDGRVWLFDAGEGTQHQLLRCPGVSSGRIERIFVTHLHGDHCYGLPGLICSTSMMWQPPGIVKLPEGYDPEDDDCPQIHDHFSKSSQFLEIYGPCGLAELLRVVFRTSEAGFGFQYRVTELLPSDQQPSIPPVLQAHEAPPRYVFPDPEGAYQLPADDFGGISVRAAQLTHRVPCVGYAITEPTTPGALDMEIAKRLGIPKGPLLGKLKAGETIEFDVEGEKRIIRPTDVLGPAIVGRTVLLLGDTCDSAKCHRIASGCEWVVHEATFDDANEKLAVPRGHSTSRMAAKFAQALGAKNLVLTHFSARFAPAAKDPEQIQRLISQAQEVFGQNVFAAEDFWSLDLSRKKV